MELGKDHYGIKEVVLLQSLDGMADLTGIDAADIVAAQATGAGLWQRFACVDCHVPGQAIGSRLDTLRQRYDVASLADYFLFPTAPMPAFPLDAAERRALAIWLLARAQSTDAPAG